MSINIKTIIADARKEMEGEVSSFNYSNRCVQQITSQSINLFSPNAMSEFREILSTARDACDNLYTTCQSLVISVDSICRKELCESSELELVQDVYLLIKELNENSDIEHNVGTSIDDVDLLDASVKYSPSVEAKAIEKYWEMKYKSDPGYSALQAKIREDKVRLEKKLEDEKNILEQMIMDFIQKRLELFERKYNELKTKQDKEINAIELKYQKEIDKLEKQKNDILNRINTYNSEYNSLGFFALKRKKELKQTIKSGYEETFSVDQNISKQKELLKKEKDNVNNQYSDSLDLYDVSWTQTCEEHPCPEDLRNKCYELLKLRKRDLSGSKNEILESEILDVLAYNGICRINDIVESLDYDDLDYRKCSALLRSMRISNLINRIETKKYTLYYII